MPAQQEVITKADPVQVKEDDKQLLVAKSLYPDGEFKIHDTKVIYAKRGIPFLFTSGYGANGLVDDYYGAHLLTKPFSVGDLGHKIAQLMERCP